MPFSSLTGNDRIKGLLQRAVAEGRIGHGLIMSGPRGVGKHRFALALAQAVNCDRPVDGDACGQCLPCRKIDRGEHPDVQTITPDGAFIKIAQMREMSREAQYRPFEARFRVLIIDGADRLREAAANSTLKILEEPPETSLIILVTSKPYALLETIRSRCQLLNFGPLTAAEIESRLRASEKGSAEDLRLRARLARGSIGRAMAVDLEQYREERKVPLQLLESLALRPDTADLLNAAEYLGRKLERKEFEEHMDAFVTLLNDAFYLKLGLPADSITNLDIVNRLERIAEMMTLDRIIALAEHNEQMIQALNRNINRQLALEAMLVSV